MSQIPPPPPGQPAPMGGTPGAMGSNKKTYTILAYALGWIGGLIFLFVGKDDPDISIRCLVLDTTQYPMLPAGSALPSR